MGFEGRPTEKEYGEYFAGYVAKVDSENVISFLEQQLHDLQTTLGDASEENASLVHEPYTWTIKQVMGHLIDGEKVFGYRLHRIAVGDTTPMPGFDHEPYVENLDYNDVSLKDLVSEFAALRQSNILFLQRLPQDSWRNKSIASDCEFSTLGKAFVIGGHVQHHLDIMKQRLSS